MALLTTTMYNTVNLVLYFLLSIGKTKKKAAFVDGSTNERKKIIIIIIIITRIRDNL